MANQDDSIKFVELLQGGNITTEVIAKVKKAGYLTVTTVAHTSSRILTKTTGIEASTAQELVQRAATFVDIGFHSGMDVHTKRGELARLKTGSEEVDKMLNGGIELGSITEIFGDPGCGKTEFCHSLVVTSQLLVDPLTGRSKKCIYIDTEGTFKPERLVTIANKYGLNSDDVLRNVSHALARNSQHQTDLLIQAGSILSESSVSLIIVDSVTAFYRQEFQGTKELPARQFHLGKFMGLLHRLVAEYGCAAVITNKVCAQVDDQSNNGDTLKKKPYGGNVLAHSSTTRLHLHRAKNGMRYCRIYDSPCLPERETSFAIREHGIDDDNVQR